MDEKREEFLNLKQGSGSVCDYQGHFNRLGCYAPDEVSTDAKKQKLFRKGLAPKIRHDLNLIDCNSFQELFNKAMKAERGNAEYGGFNATGSEVHFAESVKRSTHYYCCY